MFIKEIVVRCESGLHNRQATYFVQKANEFTCSIWLESENRKMNAKSLLGIMSLGIVTGAILNIALDPLLIFGLDLGVAGAGWATIISQFVSFCLLLVGCSKGSNIRISIKNFKFKFFYFKMIFYL